MIHTLNKACGESGISEAMLDKAFEVWYPTLEEELNGLKEDNENDLEKNIQEENHSTEIIEEILELSRDNQKLLRNPDSKLNDSIDELKERLDLTLSKVERNIDLKNEECLENINLCSWKNLFTPFCQIVKNNMLF